MREGALRLQSVPDCACPGDPWGQLILVECRSRTGSAAQVAHAAGKRPVRSFELQSGATGTLRFPLRINQGSVGISALAALVWEMLILPEPCTAHRPEWSLRFCLDAQHPEPAS